MILVLLWHAVTGISVETVETGRHNRQAPYTLLLGGTNYFFFWGGEGAPGRVAGGVGGGTWGVNIDSKQ
jgi:hypothetical protein